MADQLNAAIDRVAAKLVSVEPDQLMADRIASQLPERLATRSWMIRLAPQFAAATAMALLAYFLFSNRSTDAGLRTATHDVAPAASASARETSGELRRDPAVAASGREGGPVASASARETSGELRWDLAVAASGREGRLAADTFDRDFGLKPVAGPREIALVGIEAPPVIDLPSVEVAPIVLTDLPLASESPSPR